MFPYCILLRWLGLPVAAPIYLISIVCIFFNHKCFWRMRMEAGKAWGGPGGALLRRTDGMGITKKRPCIHMGVHVLEPATGFEPATYALRMRRSTS